MVETRSGVQPARDDTATAQIEPPPQRGSGLLALFIFLLLLRSINALTVQTFFQPDEYFQSLEPAWNLAYGNESKAWVTWEWKEHLRSSIHPWMFAKLYELLSIVFRTSPGSSIDHSFAEAVLLAPKLLQALFAAVMDIYTYKLAAKIYAPNSSASYAALALTVCSPWQWFCSTRTLSNCLETTLTIVALDLWPWSYFLQRGHQTPAISKPGSENDLDQNAFAVNLKQFLETGGKNVPSEREARSEGAVGPKAFHAKKPIGLDAALLAAALACILRPTNLVIWATVSIFLLATHGDSERALTLTNQALLCGPTVLAVSLAFDRMYYGTWTFPPIKFLYFNLVQALAVFYGKNRMDYYFTEGLPLMLTTALPFAITGIWRSLRPGPDRSGFHGYQGRQIRLILASVVLTAILVLSLVSHKEVRFIYPLLPILHILAAEPLARFFHPFPLPSSYVRVGLLAFGFTVNVYIAAYVSLVHQRGVIDVMQFLRHDFEAASVLSNASATMSTEIGFLMPCHSTPWRSHFVYPQIDAWALTCEPPIHIAMADRSSYMDEADQFYANPTDWIFQNLADPSFVHTETETGSAESKSRSQDRSGQGYGKPGMEVSRRPWPQYLVFFEQLEPTLNAVLKGSRYQECWRGFNTHWHDDWRRQGDVIVWCLTK